MFSRRNILKGFTLAKNSGDESAGCADKLSPRDPNSRGSFARGPAEDRAMPAPISVATKNDTGRSPGMALWLRRTDQLLLGFLLIALLTLLVAFRWKLSGGGRGEIEIVSQQPREFFYSLDVNNASWVEWAQLDGIGEKLAKRIIEDREKHGPFESIDDIRRVRGLGPKLIEKLRPFLKCKRENSRK